MPPLPVIRPPALVNGDCIGLAAPASSFDRQALQRGIDVLQSWGFRVHYTSRLFEKYRYLAGSDAARAAELHALFVNPEIKAIFCCRGGYGCQRLVPYLDPRLIMEHPKIVMGYSDITSLLLYLYTQCRLVTFHGPVVCGDLHPETAAGIQPQLLGVLSGTPGVMQPSAQRLRSITVLQAGDAAGPLLGGCLSLFTAALGTPLQPDTRGAILFFEDRGERLYAVDRMLTHLRLAGVFDGVRGVVFGSLERVQADHGQPYGMQDVILDVLGDLQIPILYGLPAGHCPQPLVLPLGTRVAIRESRLMFCEPPVVSPSETLQEPERGTP